MLSKTHPRQNSLCSFGLLQSSQKYPALKSNLRFTILTIPCFLRLPQKQATTRRTGSSEKRSWRVATPLAVTLDPTRQLRSDRKHGCTTVNVHQEYKRKGAVVWFLFAKGAGEVKFRGVLPSQLVDSKSDARCLLAPPPSFCCPHQVVLQELKYEASGNPSYSPEFQLLFLIYSDPWKRLWQVADMQVMPNRRTVMPRGACMAGSACKQNSLLKI